MKRLIASITAYHISNNDFDKFDINKSLDNNGVGIARYGAGLYFTDNKEEALSYGKLLNEGDKYLYTVSLSCSKNEMLNLDDSSQSQSVEKKLNALMEDKAKEKTIEKIKQTDDVEQINSALFMIGLDNLSIDCDKSTDEYEIVKQFLKAKNMEETPENIEKAYDLIIQDDEWSNKLNNDSQTISSEQKAELLKKVENSKCDIDIDNFIRTGNIYTDLCAFMDCGQDEMSKMLNSVGIKGAIHDSYYILYDDDIITITNKEVVK